MSQSRKAHFTGSLRTPYLFTFLLKNNSCFLLFSANICQATFWVRKGLCLKLFLAEFHKTYCHLDHRRGLRATVLCLPLTYYSKTRFLLCFLQRKHGFFSVLVFYFKFLAFCCLLYCRVLKIIRRFIPYSYF